MINTDDILDITEPQQPFNGGLVRYGIVTRIDGGVPYVMFDGETAESQKRYARLSGYTSAVGDRVVLLETAGTFLILGRVIK